ncbi:hypothetical protein [Alistipes sp. ZOR0009]|uniref:hypothetical protein n=1 Tax=Alistipes sp. ZOR0009 TaxID=1339253 RepID=UPI00064682CF|nr:hypothetical protein [Alistipes sp. ZOR0009]
MELKHRLEECVVTTNRGDRFDMQFGVETDLKDECSAFTFEDLDPIINFSCLDCKEKLQIDDFPSFAPRLGIVPFEVVPEKFIEFVKFIASKLAYEIVYIDENFRCAIASKKHVLFHEKNYIPNVYYTKCPHCGSQYLMFYSFSGGGQDRCPVTLTIDSIWQVHLDEAFAQKYLTVER